jgi:xanthine dehydrogenase YagR molybdenum-binding subunit
MTDQRYANRPRVDAVDKVRGRAIYASDDARPEMLHAALAVSTVPKGTIRTIDSRAASAMPGVRLVLTHRDLAQLPAAGYLLSGGFASQSIQVMTSAKVAYRGQPIAMVVADTIEIATAAAATIRATYDVEPVRLSIDEPPPADVVAQEGSPLPQAMFADRKAGDADAAFAAAAVKIDQRYTSPPQHPNPIELISTVAEWRGDTLRIHEGTQNSGAIRAGLARQLGISLEKIEVVSPQAGGAFGQKNAQQMQTVLAAIAAQRTRHPVKLVVSRSQLFHDATFRPASRHRVRLGADKSGKFLAAIHETDQQTSRHDLYTSQFAETTSRLHGFPAFRGRERLVRNDFQTPGYMRAPYEHPGTFAVESAVDELAYALGIDPVALRLANDAARDPITAKPFTSRHLATCLRQGAERFGWSGRQMAPGAQRDRNGMLIGWGVACGAYKAATAAAMAKITAHADGRVALSVTGHEMGQGIRSAVAAAVSRRLGVEPGAIDLVMGDTRAVPQHTTAGSWGTASAVPTALLAADALLVKLRALGAVADGEAPDVALRRANQASISADARRAAPGAPPEAFERMQGGGVAAAGPVYPEFVAMSFVAHFVEARVEPTTRRVRIPRVVSVADCGRVLSPRTAESQMRGGIIWGMSAALREISEVEPRHGGFLNADLADYVIAVNADVGDIDVSFVDEPDPLLNEPGVKSLGEVSMTGVAAAVANAVFHATGKRHRDLPIRLEQMV